MIRLNAFWHRVITVASLALIAVAAFLGDNAVLLGVDDNLAAQIGVVFGVVAQALRVFFPTEAA